MTDPVITASNTLRASDGLLGINSDTVDIDFHGRTFKARRGESLLAALIASGEYRLRETKAGQYRGPFCGMGVCQECLVEVDGTPSLRACMTRVEQPMTVRRQMHQVSTIGQPSPSVKSEPDAGCTVLAPQIAIIGGGPAGMMAATQAASAGADVLLIDERSSLGGQYYKQPIGADDLKLSDFDDQQFRGGRDLINELTGSGATVMLSTRVIGAYEPLDLVISTKSQTLLVRPQVLIVATGAYETCYPFVGWTAPGVMTTGAAQTLLRSYRVLPGRRVLVAGNGPLNFQVAAELANAGAEVVAVVEAANRPSLSSAACIAKMVASDPYLTLKGARFLSALKRDRTAAIYSSKITRVDEVDRSGSTGLRVSLTSLLQDGPDAQTFDVDAVCLGYGFRPSNELLRALGCSHGINQRTGALETQCNETCTTTRKDVLATGDCTGLGGAPAAEAEGILAAVAALAQLGIETPDSLLQKAEQMRTARRRHKRFQEALWTLFQPSTPVMTGIDQAAIVCRCENVAYAELWKEIQTDGQGTMASVKRSTRAGMGRCQGRYCGPVIAQLMAAAAGRAIQEADLWAPRPPIKPVRIRDLARLSFDDGT